MTKRPQISVLLAVFNSEEFVGQAIASVLQQTAPQLELLVVDDGSTDGTVDVVRSFDDPRVRLFAQPVNRGSAHARNVGLDAARGDWITIIDSDDWYAPDRLEKLLRIGSTGADLVGDNFFLIRDGASKPWATQFAIAGFDMPGTRTLGIVEYVRESFPGRACLRPGLMKPLMRADFIRRHGVRYDEDVRIIEDFVLYYCCLLMGARFILVPEPLYYRRERANSLVRSDRSLLFQQNEQVNSRLLEAAAVQGDPELQMALVARSDAIAQTQSAGLLARDLRSGRFGRALAQMAATPSVLGPFLSILWWKARKAAIRGVGGRVGSVAHLLLVLAMLTGWIP